MKFTSGQAILALLLPAAWSVDITSDRNPKYVCVCFTMFFAPSQHWDLMC